MVTIPDFDALMLAYHNGASSNRDRYERWFTKHPTKTMLDTIVHDMEPASNAVHSGNSAYVEGEMSVFDFENFLNQLVSAYVGKQKFLDEAKSAGTITASQHKISSELVTRHIAALVANGAETVRKDGAVLSFTQTNRLAVSVGQSQNLVPAVEAVKAEETMNTNPSVQTRFDDGVNVPNYLLIQQRFPMRVEDVLLQFSRRYYSSGSSAETLEAIASHNADAQAQANKMFEDMTKLRVTKANFLELLTGKNIAYAAQKKWFKHLLVNNEITKAEFNAYVETVESTEQELMDSAFRNMATLNLRLSFAESARLVVEPLAPTE